MLLKRYFSNKVIKDSFCNITPSISSKINKKLYQRPHHPLYLLKETIYNYFNNIDAFKGKICDIEDPIVSVENCFDLLLTPKDYETRSPINTYYVNKDNCLRPHMTYL